MIVIKGVPLSEKTFLVMYGFVRTLITQERNQFDDNILYDIVLKSNIQIVTRKYGIEIFDPDRPKNGHYMDECMFTEVVIT